MIKVNPKIPQHYIKVPKEIILQSELPEHRISALCYLNYNQTWDQSVHYSPAYMIQWCGYKPNWRKLKDNKENIYDKFLRCMKWFNENGYILGFNSEKYIQSTFQSSLINKEKLLPPNNFGIIYDFEIETIMKYISSYRPLNKSILLLVLSYLRAFTWIRATQISGHSDKSKKKKPEIFHSQFKAMGEYLGVKEKLISKAITVLEKIGIIKTHRMPCFQDRGGTWHSDDIIFVFRYKVMVSNKALHICTKEEYDFEQELEYGISYLRNMNHVSKKFYQN